MTTIRDVIDGQPVVSHVLPLAGRARLACLECGRAAEPDDLFWGCRARGLAAPLELVYRPSAKAGLGLTAAAREARRAYTPFAADGERAPSPPTPLAPAPRFGPGVWLKHEACSLTGSHKDRFHAVTA
ncbi:MAG: PLP-dependent lyase/thiolase, partial [Chloroflexota bacterium]|nr:PLP-dependent lyase/thiolase [Chloroflexota bacterium]